MSMNMMATIPVLLRPVAEHESLMSRAATVAGLRRKLDDYL